LRRDVPRRSDAGPIEANPDYAEMARRRIDGDAALFDRMDAADD
jgi:hypothetical protein